MWRLTRLNARYAAALRLAEIVLRNQSAEPGPGGVSVAAFVVSMAKVFEDFVTVALREALAPHPGHTEAQYPGHLDEQRKIAILPDVVHLVADQPVAVFDAKYKLEDASSGYPNADVYQMLAYCTALQLPRGWLVYAQGNAPPGVQRVRHTWIDIVQYPLDLAASPADLLRQVDTLAADGPRANSGRAKRHNRDRSIDRHGPDPDFRRVGSEYRCRTGAFSVVEVA